jgi:invasion protein IalB
MNKFYIITIAALYILLSTNAYSEVNSKSWSKVCDKKDKKSCQIAIKSEIKFGGQEKATTIATAYMKIGSATQSKMDLINKDDQTYKLKKDSRNVPVLFINLPLNTDLRKQPQIILDKKPIGNLTYLHCSKNVGCKTVSILNENLLNSFKKGNTMTVVFAVFSKDKNFVIQFPLKGFTKAYKKLSKD